MGQTKAPNLRSGHLLAPEVWPRFQDLDPAEEEKNTVKYHWDYRWTPEPAVCTIFEREKQRLTRAQFRHHTMLPFVRTRAAVPLSIKIQQKSPSAAFLRVFEVPEA